MTLIGEVWLKPKTFTVKKERCSSNLCSQVPDLIPSAVRMRSDSVFFNIKMKLISLWQGCKVSHY